MQRRSPEEQVVAQPAAVDEVPCGVRPVDLHQAVGEVGADQERHREPERIHGPGAEPVGEQPHGDDEHHQVHDRERERRQSHERRERAVAGVRVHQEEPHEERRGGPDDEGVDDGSDRWPTPAAEQQEAGDEQGVVREVERIRRAGVRRVFEDVVFVEGRITQIRALADIPFEGHEVVEINLTHRQWKWNEV